MYIYKWLQRNKLANSNAQTHTCRTRNVSYTFVEYFNKFCHSTWQLPSLICYWRESKHQCISTLKRNGNTMKTFFRPKRRWWNCVMWNLYRSFWRLNLTNQPTNLTISNTKFWNMGHESSHAWSKYHRHHRKQEHRHHHHHLLIRTMNLS